MLWESVDPAVALTTRFGFTDAGHAASWLADTLWEAWAVRVDRCDRLVLSASNLLAWLTADGERIIAKCSVDPALFSRLADVAALTAWLHAEGVPVAAPIAASDGCLRVELPGVSVGLLPVIEGDLLDVGEAKQVRKAGRMLATLHQALATYPHPFDGGRPGRDRQLVHNDFRSANILQHRAEITAILDFEEVAYRSRAADLAKASVLLGTRYHDWGPTSPAARDAFVAAYSDVAPLTCAERDELHAGVIAVLNHFGWTQNAIS